MDKFKMIVIPDFEFEDGSKRTFTGFDRTCTPDDGVENSYIWKIGVFDSRGMYFTVYIDKRKKHRKKNVTFIYDGKPYYFPILEFVCWGTTLYPENGHGVSCQCEVCKPKSLISSVEVRHLELHGPFNYAMLEVTWGDQYRIQFNKVYISFVDEDDKGISFCLNPLDAIDHPRYNENLEKRMAEAISHAIESHFENHPSSDRIIQ